MRIRPFPTVIAALALLGAGIVPAASRGRATETAAQPASTQVVAAGKKVVGYFTEWGVYDRNYHVKNIKTSGSAAKLTNIVYAFGNTTGGRCTMGDSYAAYDKAYDAAGSVDGVADTWDTVRCAATSTSCAAEARVPEHQGGLVVRRLDLVRRIHRGGQEPDRVRELLLQPGRGPALGRRVRRHRHRLGVPERLRPEL